MSLRETQRRMAVAIMQPLTASGRIAKRNRRGGLMSTEATSIIRPNDRLSSLERLEIYSRSYWFRLLDSFKEDFPGLEAVFGSKGFDQMAVSYLDQCPSRSFTLRDLGSQLEVWLRAHPEYRGRTPDLALDMVRLEWAHIVAFDGAEEKVLGPEDLAELRPTLRVGVQPYISLLDLKYPVNELRVAIKRAGEGSSATSNVAVRKKQHAMRQAHRAKPDQSFVAVHRLDSIVYYRRLVREEYRLLLALRSGQSISASIRVAFAGSSTNASDIPELLKTWFSTWARFGWLTATSKHKRGRRSS